MALGQGIRFAKAFIELGLDATESQKQLRKFRNSMRSIRRISFGVGGALTAAFTPVTILLGKAVKEAARFEETASKLNVVFGKLTPQANAFVSQMERGLGQSRQEMAQFLSEFQDLLVPIGAGSDQAFALSKTLTKLAVDLGSFNNRRTEDVFRDLASALTGSSEVMKKYGVVVNETAVKQELLNNNLDPMRATEYQKALARVHIIMRSTQAAQGDAARTAGSLTNQWKAFQNQLQNTLIDMGQDLLPSVTKALTEIVALAERLTPAFKTAAESVAAIASGLATDSGVFADYSSTASERQKEIASIERALALREAYGGAAQRAISVGGLIGANASGGFGKGFFSSTEELIRRRSQLEGEGTRLQAIRDSLGIGGGGASTDVTTPSLPGLGNGLPPTNRVSGAFNATTSSGINEAQLVSLAGRALGRAIGQGAGIASDAGLTGRFIPEVAGELAKNASGLNALTSGFNVSSFAGDFVGLPSNTAVQIQKDTLKVNEEMLQWMKDNAVVFN